MKKCPQCQADYFDEHLEFCLEDGAKLKVVGNSATSARTEILDREQNSIETFSFGSELPKTVEARQPETAERQTAEVTKLDALKQKSVEKGFRALELGTLIFALAHNWWQWIYVERQNYGSISNFLLSLDFLIWFLLLLAGAACGILTLKFSSKKEMAYIGLVILAINFILLLVPLK